MRYPILERSRASFVLALAVLASASVLFLARPRPAHADTNTRVVEITAKRFGFTPDHITLKKGEPVILRLNSQDVTHGFFSRPLHIDAEVHPGQSTDVAITPEGAGTFTTICHHFCGVGHGNMKMVITVE